MEGLQTDVQHSWRSTELFGLEQSELNPKACSPRRTHGTGSAIRHSVEIQHFKRQCFAFLQMLSCKRGDTVAESTLIISTAFFLLLLQDKLNN